MRHQITAIEQSIDYIQHLFAPEDELLRLIKQKLKQIGWSIHIGSEEGKLLQLLIQMASVHTIVEIGTLGGYSALWMARALPDKGKIYTIEKQEEMTLIAKDFFKQSEVNDRIELLTGMAEDRLLDIEPNGPFDMIFIDADKRNYLHYLDWAEQHIRKGGLIIADNTFLFGAVYQDSLPEGVKASSREIMREFNQRLADPNRYQSILLPTVEGMTIAIKQF